MITLLFSRGGNFGAEAIEWYSHGEWSHVDTVLDDGLLGARSDNTGGKPPGVQVRDPAYLKDEPRLRVVLQCPPQTASAYEAFLRAQIGKPYDKEGIAGFIFGRQWRDPSAWFCSELTAAGLEAAGYFRHPLSAPANKITPSDLLLALSARVPITA